MKKLVYSIGFILFFITPLSFAQNEVGKLLDAKLAQAASYVNKKEDITKAWEKMVEIAYIIQQHPEYDDGEYAEGIIDLTSTILTKPWKYTKPYLIGSKSTTLFQNFILNHINDLSTESDLKVIKKIILKNCDQYQYPICKKLLIKVEQYS